MSRRPKKPAARAPEVSGVEVLSPDDPRYDVHTALDPEAIDEALEAAPSEEPESEASESDPTPSVEKPAEPVPAVTVVQGPAARDPSLTARIKPPTYDVATWVRSANIKPGMARAFIVWATQHHPQAKYAPEKWQDFYEKFLLSPVGR